MDSRGAALDEALRAQLASGCVGAVLAVSDRRTGFEYATAAGSFDGSPARRLEPTAAFRAASVTKAVTAAAAIRLAAEGRWDPDAPVRPFLPLRATRALEALEGLDDWNALTIRRLLEHTSGIPDYFFDERFQARVAADPTRVWQPEDLVEAAAEGGRLLFPPGGGFSYGDTGYVLVGLAIEQLLGCRLADAYRRLVFDPLGMQATFLEWHEPERGVELSHHFSGGVDLAHENFSFDWAGGGLVTTAADLVAFLHGLFDGRLFEERWLAQMTDWRSQLRWRPRSSARYLRYGLGLGVNVAFGEEIVGATGVWGAFAYYWPRHSAAIAGTLNLVGADRAALMDATIGALGSST